MAIYGNQCDACGAWRDAMNQTIVHREGCPLNEKPGLTMVDRMLAPETSQDEFPKPEPIGEAFRGHVVSSLGAKRFEKERKGDRNPSNVSIRDVLEAALLWLQDNRADHVLIMLGTEMGGGAVSTKFMQGGTYNVHAQIGLAARTQDALIHPEGNLD